MEGKPNSWTPIAPSPRAFGANLSRVPQEMTLQDIARVQADTVHTVERARELGFEWLMLHFAHGYLAQNFLVDSFQCTNRSIRRQRRKSWSLSARNLDRCQKSLAGKSAIVRSIQRC